MDLINIDDVSGVLIRVVPAAAILYYASESTRYVSFRVVVNL